MSKLLGVLEYVKLMVEKYQNSDALAIDMTLGNGNDTLLLTQYFKFVYAFDIQEQAIINSETLLKERNNYQLILDSHEHVDLYVKEKVGLIIYNLGYLPQSDKLITTQADSTLISISKGLDLLNKDSLMIIVVYSGHDDNEAEAVDNYIKKLNPKLYHISLYKIISAKKAPNVYCINKKKVI
jgi:hypothetical protein